jgi:hypothetical protein
MSISFKEWLEKNPLPHSSAAELLGIPLKLFKKYVENPESIPASFLEQINSPQETTPFLVKNGPIDKTELIARLREENIDSFFITPPSFLVNGIENLDEEKEDRQFLFKSYVCTSDLIGAIWLPKNIQRTFNSDGMTPYKENNTEWCPIFTIIDFIYDLDDKDHAKIRCMRKNNVIYIYGKSIHEIVDDIISLLENEQSNL